MRMTCTVSGAFVLRLDSHTCKQANEFSDDPSIMIMLSPFRKRMLSFVKYADIVAYFNKNVFLNTNHIDFQKDFFLFVFNPNI